ncbi:unnamed protein product [Phytophthora fragariaefolia]|uniref:Unnamed protein product n=1 Tax=Phytophthora fragariaefolia TaxID=1490495 RepID=A0A9W7CLM0_9STRA|nr:unnamed protein product [Phytophthora fragariaefolia]
MFLMRGYIFLSVPNSNFPTVNQAVDLTDAAHKGMAVIKDLEDAGAEDAVIEEALQELIPLIAKCVAEMNKAATST